MAFTPYGEQSKRHRRLLHKALGIPTIPQYHPLLLTSTHTFLRALVKEPALYTGHIRRYTGGSILSVVYGYQPVPAEATGLSPTNGSASIATAHRAKGDSEGEVDPFLRLAEECVAILSEKIASGGGVWPVDVLPSLQYIPEWVPGGGFKRSARAWKKKMEEFVDKPYEFVKSSMVCLV